MPPRLSAVHFPAPRPQGRSCCGKSERFRMEQPAWHYDSGVPTPSAVPAAARTLVIDLEGALLRSELLLEALFSSPGRMLARFGAGGRPGMAALTDILAQAELDYAHLP